MRCAVTRLTVHSVVFLCCLSEAMSFMMPLLRSNITMTGRTQLQYKDKKKVNGFCPLIQEYKCVWLFNFRKALFQTKWQVKYFVSFRRSPFFILMHESDLMDICVIWGSGGMFQDGYGKRGLLGNIDVNAKHSE